MELKGIFGGPFEIIEKAMNLRSIKHNIIVSNISNADTPNYRAFDMIIENEITKNSSDERLSLATSNKMHINENKTMVTQGIGNISENMGHTIRGDNNSVEIDKEVSKLMENNLVYNSLASVISKKFRGLRTVIQTNRG